MNEPNPAGTLEEQIAQWRTYVCRRPDLAAGELERLEDQLRREVAGLIRAGLTTEEAFLVAVKRLGRVAALGENVILLVNLAWSAVLCFRFLIRRGSFQSLERWQTAYLPAYAGWGASVVILFPPFFRWIG